MKLIKTFILFIFFITCSCNSQKNEFNCNPNVTEFFNEYDYNDINEEWLEKGINYYEELKHVFANAPNEIINIINTEKKEPIMLGNGFSVKKGAYGKGYIGVFYTFIYKNDKLISYRLNLPLEDIMLLEKYNFKPRKLFKQTKGPYNFDNYTYSHNYKTVSMPHKEIEIKKGLSDKMKHYMTPYSGITYGCRGGYGGGMLENRCVFKQLIYKQDLTVDDLIYIMHSINLASRLTAIEYYTRHIDRFSKEEQAKIETIIKTIFLEFGDTKIDVLEYDIGFHSTIEEAVNKQLESDCF